MKTLLEIVNAVQGELGLPITSTVVGNSDATTTQLLYLTNRCIDEIRRQAPTGWQVCQFEYNIVVAPPVETTGDVTQNSAAITNIPSTSGITASLYIASGDGIPTAARVLSVATSVTTQLTLTMEYTGDTATAVDLTFARDTYPMPSDYDWTQNDTHWDRTNFWQLVGPDSPQRNQWELSGIVATGPRRHYRQLGPGTSSWRIWPPPIEITDPLQLVFEYLSLNTVVTAAGTYAQYFTADTDEPLLDDQAVIMGVKWMFFENKGFNVLNPQSRWIDYVQTLIARDGPAPTLSLAKRFDSMLLSPNNVQDGNWPSS